MAPQFIAKPAATQAVRLLVKLPLRNAGELETLTRLQSDPRSAVYHRFISVAQFRARYAPTPGTLKQAVAALEGSGFSVRKADSQLLHVDAPVAAIERALGIRLGVVQDAAGRRRIAAARGAMHLPKMLAALGASLVGLQYAVRPRPQLRMLAPLDPHNRYSNHGDYWFDDLKEAYSYPAYTPFNGKGVTIATVGESDFSDSDAALYFNHELLGGGNALAPAPALLHLGLGGLPFDPTTTISDEANLDVQQAGGSAPGATIVGVGVPSAFEGFLYGYSAIDELNTVDIVSTSYGECELFYTPAYNNGIDQTSILRAYHDLFLQGNAQGITFVFSSGDDGGLACPQPEYLLKPGTGTVYADRPGTSIWSDDPSATSVGGTNLQTSSIPGKLTSTYQSENAFHDTVLGPIDPYGVGNSIGNAIWGSGGGPSTIFKQPWYQELVQTGSSMRVDPDIAMHMGGCPLEFDDQHNPVPVQCGKADSGVIGYVGGTAYGFIGTSASAPEFAGLLAVLEQSQGNVRLGNVNGYLYELARTNTIVGGRHPYRQGIPGNNGVVVVKPGQLGYNQILGVGTPIANDFLLLPFAPPAGDPQTTGNP